MQKLPKIRTGNRRLMQELNINLVLEIIRKNGPISQVEISRLTRLSSATVTNIVKILKGENLVREVGAAESSGGRKPVLLSLNPDARYVLAAAFFAEEITVAILDLLGEVKKKAKIFTEVEKGQKAVFENFARAADSLLNEFQIGKENILGLGVSFEGIVDHQRGVLILSSHFGWRDVPVKRILEESYGLKTFVEGNGRAMALGEYYYGVGQGANNMVCIDINSGIGSAWIFEGKVYRGAFSMEGEIGHIQVVPDGPKCRCGKRGCLEAVASGAALIARVKEALKNDRRFKSLYQRNPLPEHLMARTIFQTAKGNQAVLNIIEEIGNYLGLMVANVVNYSDPELIVLNGYMVNESGELLLNIIKRVAREHMIAASSRKIKIKKGTLGEDAAFIGAASLVYQDFFPYF